jgi:hypothetical protein
MASHRQRVALRAAGLRQLFLRLIWIWTIFLANRARRAGISALRRGPLAKVCSRE